VNLEALDNFEVFHKHISRALQYVMVLTSNHFWAPAGSQAAKPPFLLCIKPNNRVYGYEHTQILKK
jgi:hypothetical protein